MNIRELLKMSEELDVDNVDGDEPVQALEQEEQQKESEEQGEQSEEAVDEQPGELPSVSAEVLEEADTPQVDVEEVSEAELPEPSPEDVTVEASEQNQEPQGEIAEPKQDEIQEQDLPEPSDPATETPVHQDRPSEELPEPSPDPGDAPRASEEEQPEWPADPETDDAGYHAEEVTEQPMTQAAFDEREASQQGEIYDATMQRINDHEKQSRDFATSIVDGVRPMFDDMNLRLEIAFNESMARMISEQEMLRTY